MFDVKQTTEDIVQWIRQWFENNGKGCNAVVGISGGKDSSVVAALCAKALGKDRVIGVLMPNGEQSDIDCSKQLVAHLCIPYFVCNIKKSVDGAIEALQDAGVELTRQTLINLPPRIRMSTLYALSQSKNGRVANTCNLSEDWVGYSTRYGDAAGDFSPLGKLTVQEVKQVGKYLNLPINLVEKVPSDGLSGKTDEDNLGFTYAVLDRYIRDGVCEDLETKARIDRLHTINEFKLKPIPCFEYQP
jgi:NAD+ synthase